jgi:hypothetical protein
MKFTEDTLKATIFVLPYFDLAKISGIEQTADAWRLGEIGLKKGKPVFRAYLRGFSSTLADTAQFHTMPFDVPEVDRKGWAVIFTRFAGEEYLAGWVSDESKGQLDEWVAFMNQQIGQLLKLKTTAAKSE